MKRSILLVVAMAMALLMVSGVAIARTVYCDGGKCRGTNTRDTMYGTEGRDIINSLEGADLARGKGGADTLKGDGGKDRLSGGKGNDVVYGSDDDDRVAGNSGFDALSGGNADDLILAVDGMTDQITCGNGRHDIVFFDRGVDNLRDRGECEVRRPK
ncbi:MAG TPA: calcium-binding protein [Rubrobacteraceae bacterium]|nr:calcium-binding protein [Rubrobacteraceae bacterium]